MKYKPYRTSKTHTLDYRRTEEQVNVHLAGDASRMLWVNRGCILLDTVEQIAAITTRLMPGRTLNGGEVVGVVNRFERPAGTGYRDLKAFVRDDKVGHISTLRVVHTEFEESTFARTAPFAWEMRKISARVAIGAIPAGAAVVLVSDNYLRDDDHSLMAVHGFVHPLQAWHYAVSRFKDGIRVLTSEATSTQDLKYSWLVYGEDVAIFTGDQLHFFGSELMAHILTLRISDTSYWQYEEDFGLAKTPVKLIAPSDSDENPSVSTPTN